MRCLAEVFYVWFNWLSLMDNSWNFLVGFVVLFFSSTRMDPVSGSDLFMVPCRFWFIVSCGEGQ